MTGKPEILFLSHRIPFPPDKGDKIRSWRLLGHLCERFRVHLACFVDDSADFIHQSALEAVCESVALVPLDPLFARARSVVGFITGEALTFPYYRDQRMAEHSARLRARPLAAEIAFSSAMAPYLEEAVEGRPRIVDFCDADSMKWRQYAARAKGPMRFVYAREAMLLAEAENAIAGWAEARFAITPVEAAVFNDRPGVDAKVDWWANGVDANYFDPAFGYAPLDRTADVIFTGAMDYQPNMDAVAWFVREIWPTVRQRRPDSRFAVIGPRPARALRALDGRNGVIVTGRVDDVRPWLAQAGAVVAPMRIARGVQNKVLEAMAMARPVIATQAAAEGIEAEPGADLIVADAAPAFAEALSTVLEAPEKAAALGRSARVRVCEGYEWAARLRRFDAALERLGVA
ncbi:MAG: TIGR03087 family PEP-CTERM/XrtA system glycosyltransferase [Parvularculaceae bacterium]